MNLDDLLEKYENAKELIKKYENRIEKYKKAINKELTKQGTSSLIGEDYKVVRRNNTRQYVSRESLPPDIFEKYAVRSTYFSYYVSRIKKTKKTS